MNLITFQPHNYYEHGHIILIKLKSKFMSVHIHFIRIIPAFSFGYGVYVYIMMHARVYYIICWRKGWDEQMYGKCIYYIKILELVENFWVDLPDAKNEPGAQCMYTVYIVKLLYRNV